jgi:AraC family transcriptional regulator
MYNKEPRIDFLKEKSLIGQSRTMSFIKNSTAELWKGFMPRKNEIKKRIGNEFFSLEIFPEKFFDKFDPSAEFEKWAAVEVEDHYFVPDNMKSLVIPEGDYAVFVHKGPYTEAEKTYSYIFKEWLPASKYTVDNRPHFALMGDKYNKDSPDSEEEVWIPIRPKL